MRRPRLDRLPAGLLGSLALVMAIERGVTNHEGALAPPWTTDWRHAGGAARREAPRAEVLCLGDSLVKFAVLPRAIEGRSGRRAYNLAVHNGQAPATYFLLRRALDAGARPAAVLVDFAPHLLTGGPYANLRQWGELVEPGECLDLARTARDADLFALITAARLLPSYAARFEIRGAVLGALAGRSTSQSAVTDAYRRNWRRNLGALAMPGNPASRADTPFGGDLVDAARPFDPVNLAYIRRLLDLTAARRIPVYWLLPPPNPSVQAIRDRNGSDDRYLALIRRLGATHPGLTVLDARHSGYDHSLHFDPVHLDHRGAAALSRSIADALATPPDLHPAPGPRVVDLLAYRDRPGGVPIEDLTQSTLAIRGSAAVRR